MFADLCSNVGDVFKRKFTINYSPNLLNIFTNVVECPPPTAAARCFLAHGPNRNGRASCVCCKLDDDWLAVLGPCVCCKLDDDWLAVLGPVFSKCLLIRNSCFFANMATKLPHWSQSLNIVYKKKTVVFSIITQACQ